MLLFDLFLHLVIQHVVTISSFFFSFFTVQCGRSTLEWVIDEVNTHPSWRAKVVYGDTDSVFVHLKGRTKAEAFEIGAQIAHEMTQKSPVDVLLKMEKVYLPCVLVSKKRYVGNAFEDPNPESSEVPHFDAKGIEVVRRDQCGATVKIQEKALRLLFQTKDLSLVKEYLYKQVSEGFSLVTIGRSVSAVFELKSLCSNLCLYVLMLFCYYFNSSMHQEII